MTDFKNINLSGIDKLGVSNSGNNLGEITAQSLPARPLSPEEAAAKAREGSNAATRSDIINRMASNVTYNKITTGELPASALFVKDKNGKATWDNRTPEWQAVRDQIAAEWAEASYQAEHRSNGDLGAMSRPVSEDRTPIQNGPDKAR